MKLGIRATRQFVTCILVQLPLVTAEWIESYSGGELVGHRDPHGVQIAGSSIGHLIAHKGKLFAANGYYLDTSSGLTDGFKNGLWAQVLRKDTSQAEWTVDLQLGASHIRCEILQSVTFKTNGSGHIVHPPVNLLLASTYGAPDVPSHHVGISVFVRDDTQQTWSRKTIFVAQRPANMEDLSVRAILEHTDAVTGVSMVFISLGVHGILSGVYNSLSQQVEWSEHPESPSVDMRPLAIVRANTRLYFSAGLKIYKRIDGKHPAYTVVHDASDLAPSKLHSTWGGIRGMSPIPEEGGHGKRESLIFAIQAYANSPVEGCIYRIDLNSMTGDAMKRTNEVCLIGESSPVKTYLSNASVYGIFGAYNGMVGFYPLSGSKTDPVHLFGLEASTDSRFGLPIWGGLGDLIGMYRGGLFCIRTLRGPHGSVAYNCNEVAGPSTYKKPPKVAVVTYTFSPFSDESGTLYFGGHDINPSYSIWSDSHAWITKGSLEGDVMPSLDVRPSSASWKRLSLPSIVPSHGLWNNFGWAEDPWFDSTTGLEWTNGRGIDRRGAAPTRCTWQPRTTGCVMSFFDAVEFCKNNTYNVQAGRYPGERWRLPRISELRSFIRSCPSTEYVPQCGLPQIGCNIDSEGQCGKNLTAVAQRSSLCNGCRTYQGPDDGCYWSTRMAGRCAIYLSSTRASDDSGRVWALNQENGKVLAPSIWEQLDVRCVRGNFAYNQQPRVQEIPEGHRSSLDRVFV